MKKLQLTPGIGLLQKIKELTPKLIGDNLNRNKKLFAGSDKAKTIATKPASRDNGMNMRMK